MITVTIMICAFALVQLGVIGFLVYSYVVAKARNEGWSVAYQELQEQFEKTDLLKDQLYSRFILNNHTSMSINELEQYLEAEDNSVSKAIVDIANISRKGTDVGNITQEIIENYVILDRTKLNKK